MFSGPVDNSPLANTENLDSKFEVLYQGCERQRDQVLRGVSEFFSRLTTIEQHNFIKMLMNGDDSYITRNQDLIFDFCHVYRIRRFIQDFAISSYLFLKPTEENNYDQKIACIERLWKKYSPNNVCDFNLIIRACDGFLNGAISPELFFTFLSENMVQRPGFHNCSNHLLKGFLQLIAHQLAPKLVYSMGQSDFIKAATEQWGKKVSPMVLNANYQMCVGLTQQLRSGLNHSRMFRQSQKKSEQQYQVVMAPLQSKRLRSNP